MTDINKQQRYIEEVKKISINPLKCSNNFFNQKQQKCIPGKRYSLNHYKLKDYLTVASNEVIFELDSKTYSTNYKIAKQIIDVLDSRKIPYYIFDSGGKGIHVQVWLQKPAFENEEQRKLLIDAISYGLSFKHIRFWFWNNILDEALLNPDLRGQGKVIDSSCINFDDLNDKTKLIRTCGGRKITVDKITKNKTCAYKSYIPKEQFNKNKHKITNFENVQYPEDLKSYQINVNEFIGFLQEFVNNAKKINLDKEVYVDLSQNKGYMGLDAVQRILEGMPIGKRNEGAKVLSIAMANDDLNLKQQKNIMKKYVQNCSNMDGDFCLEEALGWINWMQNQNTVFWNCGLTENLGVHKKELCKFCDLKHRKSNKFLEQSKMLDKIKEVLDIKIKGEDDTKMLMFLLMLSKDFPSRTGSPSWNIPGDPMSQNIVLSSESSSGKTFITKQILDLIGDKDEDYFVVSRSTKSVLNYYTEENMDGKIIFIEEIQGLDENTEQLRVWMSEGELNLETVEKCRDEDGNEVNMKVKKTTIGQPVFITNQAEGVVEDQLNNRSWVLGTDVSPSQTQNILNYQDDINQGCIIDIDEKVRIIKDALKQLKPYHFLIPFANYKKLNIPTNDVRSRRDYNKFMSLIKCSAYLHQKQRKILIKDNREFIVCSLEDYDIAKQYSVSILGATFSGLTIKQIDCINYIRKSNWKSEFEIRDLMRNFGKSQSYWYGQLKQLCELGYVFSDSSGKGKPTLYSLNENKIINIIKLPSSEELIDEYAEGIEKLKDSGYKEK